ncbi:glucosamine-6-phosphate deaminase [Dethiobacter alkaliphilus]|uniref:glucosamine-6-phosphate deaminase n=1 Tax=Dethiobacter alkaliphilus TaxID=427926 RepID=UPI0022268151|nr:glucosamine-6-phosphate deaminase [Dethiobacter alkaliphilus]MCW3490616.1 glucosamine-6-phosphate deaminase [Dethiobacter alkaliphilus]
MKIIVVEDYREMSKKAADIVASQVILKNDSVLGLATGSTPEGMYSRLVELHREGTVDFSSTQSFNLDEYLGLDPEHSQSYHHYMHCHLFNHINTDPNNVHIPSGQASDMAAYCRNYDQQIAAAGGIDLQVLGIGGNGHIGFNEPDEFLSAGTHVVDLTEETVEANSRFFASRDEVPKKAVTMGMGSIMKAKKILLLASGIGKAQAIKATVSGNVSTRVPASFLQLHRDVTLILDEEAAALLP